jgi:hypothetical protein
MAAGFPLVADSVAGAGAADVGGRRWAGSTVRVAGRGGIGVAVLGASAAGVLAGLLAGRIAAGICGAWSPRLAATRTPFLCGVFSTTSCRSILTPPGVPGRLPPLCGDGAALWVLLLADVGMNRPSLFRGWLRIIVATSHNKCEFVTCPSTLDLALKSSSTDDREARDTLSAMWLIA